MGTRQDEYNQMIADLDAATNDIAADYALLLDQVANNSVSAESIATGRANVDRLKALGASVDNPVPPPPPPVE